MNYPHTMTPFEHQRVEQEQHWQKKWRGIFWEQGTGKMKAGYDLAITQWKAGKIEGFVAIAPNGVHRDWIEEGFVPGHGGPSLAPPAYHDDIERDFYYGSKANTKWHQKRMMELLDSDKFTVLAMSYDSVKTKPNKASGWMGGRKFLEAFLKKKKCLLILDESTAIQTPSANITKILAGPNTRYGGLGELALSRRIMDGTPVDEGPFNIYSQMKFLNQHFWHDHGFSDFLSFKTYFGIFKQDETKDGRTFEFCVGYRRLEELRKILINDCSRVLKRDALDLPDKIREHMRFDMSPAQWKMYNQLEEEMWTIVGGRDDELSLVTAEIPIVQILRLYQITAGYLPFVEDNKGNPREAIHEFPENPRLEKAMAHLKSRSGKCVVWCRFTRDVDLICAGLGKRAVRYDGQVKEGDRAANKREFAQGDAQFMVVQIQAGAKGHTWNMATDVLYYTNDARLRLRRQSEDRTHRGKMKHSVLYVDMLASDTVDEKRVLSLRKKLTVAETIMGDNL